MGNRCTSSGITVWVVHSAEVIERNISRSYFAVILSYATESPKMRIFRIRFTEVGLANINTLNDSTGTYIYALHISYMSKFAIFSAREYYNIPFLYQALILIWLPV